MRLPTALEVGAVLLLIVALAALAWSFDPFGRRKRAAQAAAVATQQAANNAEATRQVENVYRSEIIVRQQTREAEHAIRSAPGADQPVPPSVLDAWNRGTDGLRDAYSGEDRDTKPAS